MRFLVFLVALSLSYAQPGVYSGVLHSGAKLIPGLGVGSLTNPHYLHGAGHLGLPFANLHPYAHHLINPLLQSTGNVTLSSPYYNTYGHRLYNPASYVGLHGINSYPYSHNLLQSYGRYRRDASVGYPYSRVSPGLHYSSVGRHNHHNVITSPSTTLYRGSVSPTLSLSHRFRHPTVSYQSYHRPAAVHGYQYRSTIAQSPLIRY